MNDAEYKIIERRILARLLEIMDKASRRGTDYDEDTMQIDRIKVTLERELEDSK